MHGPSAGVRGCSGSSGSGGVSKRGDSNRRTCGASDFKHATITCGDGSHTHIGNSNFKEVAPPSPTTAIPPYLLQSDVCEGVCVTPAGKWITCHTCRGKKAGERAKLQPAMTPPLLLLLLLIFFFFFSP